MRISAEQIKENWSELQKTIDENFEGERLEKIKALHEHFQERMTLAPASGRAWYHNAFPGGYVAHVLNIIQWSLSYYELFKAQGMYVDDISKESVVFAAMFHDLGKIGNMEDDYYSPNKDEWRAKKLQEYYNHNPAIHYMTVTDRAIWILNQFGIKMTINEVLGIKLADGMYDDGNIQYLKSYAPEKKLKSNMPLIIHQADMATTRIEYELNMKLEREEEQKTRQSVEKIKDAVTTEEVTKQLSEKSKDLFEELFGEAS